MRLISWTVVISSISAILYGGVRPLVKDFNLPQVNAEQAAGTLAKVPTKAPEECFEPIDDAATEQSSEPAAKRCEEPRLANH